MEFFRKKVTPDELGIVLTEFTFSRSDINQCKEILSKVTNSISPKESHLANAHKELFIIIMFAIAYACQRTIPIDKCKAVIEAYHLCIYNRFLYEWTSKGIDEFETLLDRRYREYLEALRIKDPPNPLWHLGKSAAKHMFGEKYSHNSYVIMTISRIFTSVGEAAREMIQKSYKLI